MLRIKQDVVGEIENDHSGGRSRDCLRKTMEYWLAKGDACDYEVCNKYLPSSSIPSVPILH